MILINGEAGGEINSADRGLHYGDGLFETIEICAGHPVLLSQHLQRLVAGCEALKLPLPDKGRLIDEVKQISEHAAHAVVKIIITRGIGGRGYRQPESIQPTRIVSLYPFPDYPAIYSEQGIRARFCQTRLGLNPSLAGIKHLNRLEQVLARAEWDDPAIQEGIMLDCNDCVIEGTMTNLFYVKDKTLYTASLQFSGIAGIIRGLIIAMATQMKIPVTEHFYRQEDLLAANEVLICNSLVGIWPVRDIVGIKFEIGGITRQLQAGLLAGKQEDRTCGKS